MRKGGRGDERLVVDLHAVENLVALLQSAQNGNGILDGRLVHHDGLEPALERGILFDVFAVFVQRRRADAVQFAAREHGFQQVARVHCAVRLARADDGVQLVDEEDDFALALLDFIEHRFQALLELAAELRARNQRAHIEGKDGFVFQAFGHVAAHDSLCKPLGNRRLADARFADEHGVVFGLSRQNADDVSYLVVAADDGVELLLLGALHEVEPVFAQCVVGVLRLVAGHAVSLDFFQLGEERILRDAE